VVTLESQEMRLVTMAMTRTQMDVHPLAI